MPKLRATRSSWSSLAPCSRTIWRQPSGLRRCLFPASSESKSRARYLRPGLSGSGLYPDAGSALQGNGGRALPFALRPSALRRVLYGATLALVFRRLSFFTRLCFGRLASYWKHTLTSLLFVEAFCNEFLEQGLVAHISTFRQALETAKRKIVEADIDRLSTRARTLLLRSLFCVLKEVFRCPMLL